MAAEAGWPGACDDAVAVACRATSVSAALTPTGLTVTVTVDAWLLASLSLTVRAKDKGPVTPGAVKVGDATVASDSVTAGPDVCFQA